MKRAELQRKKLVMVRDVPEQNSGFVLKNRKVSGAPNDNIVQNHLNIALLNVF